MDVYSRIAQFYGEYRGEKRIIGKSEEGRLLFAVRLGQGRPAGISQYAIHAREWITSLLALEHAARPVTGSVWLVPLSNPDGALLSAVGIGAVSPSRREKLINCNGGTDFSLWKANAEAVDLNVNFDAHWGEGEKNVSFPAPEGYVGSAPFCAAETRALREFTLLVRPDYSVSWHTKGEEIYWRFGGYPIRGAERLARVLSAATGYPLKDAHGSVGGYKDWCIEKLHIPAFTVEAGREGASHPLGERELKDIVDHCGEALTQLSGAV